MPEEFFYFGNLHEVDVFVWNFLLFCVCLEFPFVHSIV